MDETLPWESSSALLFEAGPLRGLRCTVRWNGSELVCRVAGPDPGCETTERARWGTERAEAEPLEGDAPEERRLARDAALHLARGARTAVRVTLDLGPRKPDTAAAEALEEATCALVDRATDHLERRRLLAAAMAPAGLPARLADGSDGLDDRVAELLATPVEELRARHRETIAATQAERFGRRVLIFAPLYLSSACLNDCSYCGFRRSARIQRVQLGREVALAEARALASGGHRTIDLVTGEIPTDSFVDYVCEVVESILARTPIRRINLNLGALSEEQYARLRGAGATGYHLYQETYDPRVYLDVHGRGPKRDMVNRIEASFRALRAGFDAIGLGILLGLGPVDRDLARLARHAHALLREFPEAGLGFSLPRIQEAGQDAELLAGTRIDDATFVKALLFLRLEFPGAHLTLTTRESPALRDSLLDLGITKLSAGVSTAPGGYANPARRTARQFAIHDQRPPGEVVDRIRASGLTPVFA